MINYTKIEQEIQKHAQDWLKNGDIKYFIGYEQGENSIIARPIFIDKSKDVKRLIWSPGCIHNLTRYLIDEIKKKPKKGEEPDNRPIGIVVKPCDSKTIVELIKENILPRERVKIVGVIGGNSINPKKLDVFLQQIPREKRKNVQIEEKEDTYVIKYDGGQLKAPKEELMADKCKVCIVHKPTIFDVLVGEEHKEFQTDEFVDIKELEEMSLEERWEYWKKQMEKCVRCYACKEGCALCYCQECIFDRVKPYKWNEKSVELPENIYYHLIRAMHLAGRCIDCGECERSCPMGIPIRQLNRFLLKRAKKRFKVNPGMNTEDKSMFGTYDLKDTEEEIW